MIASVRGIAMDQFIQKDAECPHVKLVIVLSMVDHFRSHVLQRAAERVPLALIQVPVRILVQIRLASPAKVADLEYIVLVDEQIFGL